MKRTTTRRRRELAAFVAANRRLFPFAGLFLLGVALGVLAYLAAAPHLSPEQSALLRVPGLAGGWRVGLVALREACFSVVLLLTTLFLLGLWPCGAPFVLLVPLLNGLGLGVTEAYYYSLGGSGVLAVMAVILPHGLLCATLLAMASAESLQLSLGFSRLLLPPEKGGKAAESLWPRFRLYCLRFLLFLLAAVAVGMVYVLLRTLFAGVLP